MALIACDIADDGERELYGDQETRELLLTSMPVCMCTFKAGLSRDSGLEHKSKVWFKLMLVA